MGQRKYPPLTPREIIEILIARGFSLSRTRGDHKYYTCQVKGRACLAQVDTGCPQYNENMLKMLLKETGMTRDEFYCSTKVSAKKINGECASAEVLKNWSVAK